MKKLDKGQFTFHGYTRIKERTDIGEKEIRNLSRLAIKNGVNFGQVPEGAFRNYLNWKVAKRGKRIKLYRGYIFIFFLSSRRLITVYPIPEKHMEEYKKIKKTLDIKKKKSKIIVKGGKNDEENI